MIYQSSKIYLLTVCYNSEINYILSRGLILLNGPMGRIIYYPRVLSIIYFKQKKNQYIQHIYIQINSSKHNHQRRCQCSLAIMVHTNQTSIDHLITNIDGTIITSGILQYSISDHLPIFCIASSAKHKNPFKNSTHYYCNIKNLNGDVYRDDLYDTLTPIVQKFQTSSISASNFDLHFNNLVIGINKVIEKHAPLQKVIGINKIIEKLSRKLSQMSKPWMTKGLLISIKNKQKLYCNFFLKGTAFEKHFYKAYANKLTQVKNLSKKMYYTEFISKNKSNPKKMWEIINSAISTKSVISPFSLK